MANIVLGTIDRGGDGAEILIAAVNAATGENFSLNDFVLSNPEVNTATAFQKNSKLRMQPKASSGYYGFNTIYYNRVHGSELGDVILPSSAAIGMSMLSELLPTINVECGIHLKASDIIDASIPPADGNGNISIDLVFSESSIIFYSGTTISIPVPDYSSMLSDDLPTRGSNLGTPGISSTASRSDHVHPLPQITEIIGAGDAASLNVGVDPGTVAAGDHVHYASNIIGLSAVAATGNYNDLLNKPDISDIVPEGHFQEKLKELIIESGYSTVVEFNRQIVVSVTPHEIHIPGNPDDVNNPNTAKDGDVVMIKNNSGSPISIYWGAYLVKDQIAESPVYLPSGAGVTCVYSSTNKSFF